MVRAWYHDGLEDQPDQPHMAVPGQFLTTDQIKEEIGVEYFQFDADTLDTCPAYADLKKTRGYNYEDGIEMTRQTLPDYDNKMKAFYTEHLHPDEEIRFVAAGRGYFDMRARDESRWIRMELVKNDLVILPKGIYHRFTLDPKRYIKLRRLFTEEPQWIAINKPEADSHPAHQQYLRDMGTAPPVAVATTPIATPVH